MSNLTYCNLERNNDTLNVGVDGMGKKWIAVVGSPQKGRNTELMVDYVIEGLKEKDIRVEKFILNSSNILTCTGCEYCIKTRTCSIQDDVTEIIDAMKKADGYIFASPSYNYNMTAQMKSLLDRTFCLNDYSNGWESSLSPEKKAIIDVIEYYNTKHIPVANNDNIRENTIERIRNYRDF